LVSAMGALALRTYQSFGIGNAALLATFTALLGIWGIPRIFERVRPRIPTFKEIKFSLTAALLVLFVWTANQLSSLFKPAEPPIATDSAAEIQTLRQELEDAKDQSKTLERQLITKQQAFITDQQKIQFDKALRYRISTSQVPEDVPVRIYADSTDEIKARVLAEMLLAAGWKPARDQTDNFAFRPDFNVAPGITIRHPSDSGTMKAWEALRQSLTQAHITYDDSATRDSGILTIEIGG
jgi:hypothetical protein